MQRPFKANGVSSTLARPTCVLCVSAATASRGRALRPSGLAARFARVRVTTEPIGFVAQLVEQPPLKRTDRVRLSTKPLGAKALVRPLSGAPRSLTTRKDVPTTRDGARRGWALLEALPGGEAETQAAVNRPTAGSNPALAADAGLALVGEHRTRNADQAGSTPATSSTPRSTTG